MVCYVANNKLIEAPNQHQLKMASSRSTVNFCSGHMQVKKLVLYLCVAAWLAIFFVSGKLFLRRREESSILQLEALSSIQEQIDSLSSKVSEDKNSAIDVIRTLHETVNLTFSSLDQKIANLEKEFSERRHRAMEVLHALNGGTVHTVEEETTQGEATQSALQENEAKVKTTAMPSLLPRKNEVKSSANGMCIDSMEQPVGREVELYECHGEGRNQAWGFRASNWSHGLIENKVISMCLWAVDASEGSPVRTATCNESDSQQKWKLVDGAVMLDDGQSESNCLDFGSVTRKLIIRLCDSTEKSQFWTF